MDQTTTENPDPAIPAAAGSPTVGATVDHIMQFFAYDHLPPGLREVSRGFSLLALEVTETIPRNPERTVALRKLLEAKDAAVRARLAK